MEAVENVRIGWKEFVRRMEAVRDSKDEEVRREALKLRKQFKEELNSELSLNESRYRLERDQLKQRIHTLYQAIQHKDIEIQRLFNLLRDQELLLTQVRISGHCPALSQPEKPSVDELTYVASQKLPSELFKELCHSYQLEAELAQAQLVQAQQAAKQAKEQAAALQQQLKETAKVTRFKMMVAQAELETEVLQLKTELATAKAELGSSQDELATARAELDAANEKQQVIQQQHEALSAEFAAFKAENLAEFASRELIETRQAEFIQLLQQELAEAKAVLSDAQRSRGGTASPKLSRVRRSRSTQKSPNSMTVQRPRTKSSSRIVRVPYASYGDTSMQTTCRASFVRSGGLFKLRAGAL